MNKKEMIFIWENIVTYGYGASFILIVKALDYESAIKIAVETIEKEMKSNNYRLPEGIEKIETALIISGSPDVYYADRFEGKLIGVYE